MDVEALTDELEIHGQAMTAAAGEAGVDAQVATCPGWTIGDLLAHTGKVHRWATEYVREGRNAFGGGNAVMAKAPATGLVEWFAEGHAALVAALRAAPADLDTWSFLKAPSPLAFWARRQAHETAIHRADAESACGHTPEYAGQFAADGLGELLELFYGRSKGKLLADPPRTLRVTPSDIARSWHVLIGPESRTITPNGDGPADCTLRGTASDLYLDLWNRSPAGKVTVSGDAGVMTLWRELARITWS